MNMPVPDPILDKELKSGILEEIEGDRPHSTILSCDFDLRALRINSSAKGW